MIGSCRPTICASTVAGRLVTAPSTVTGAPSAPKATGAVLKISTNTSASSCGKPSRISSAAVMATGVPKPEMPSIKAPKAEADHHQDHAAVIRQIGDDPGAEGLEPARLHGDVVEQQAVEHDPHHRPEREHRTVEDRPHGQPGRHLPEIQRYDQADDQATERGLPGGAPQYAQ